jgi:GLPGLI family protein
MQNKVILIVSILFSISLYSQEMRYTFEMKFKPDSINRNNIEQEVVNLDISKDGSIFYSSNSIIRDSILDKNQSSSSQTNALSKEIWQKTISKINYLVSKKYKEKEVSYIEPIGGDTYEYSEVEPMKWQIENEVSKIENYSVQKATTKYGGRKWIAWFTTEIPFSDGPYKFSGLPGLIIKISDAKNDYEFNLIKASKISKMYKLPTRFNPILKVKKEAFAKKLEQQRKDPVSLLPPPPTSFTQSTEMTAKMKNFQKQVEKEQAKKNNPIEFY